MVVGVVIGTGVVVAIVHVVVETGVDVAVVVGTDVDVAMLDVGYWTVDHVGKEGLKWH